jgi:EmrB/QacA subfamily drug resistance transporter
MSSSLPVEQGRQSTPALSAVADERSDASRAAGRVTPEAANRILLSLIFPTVLMPMIDSTIRVALPIIRSDFQIEADVTAWVDAVFTLPFMLLMPIYGRLSDGVGKRRLMLLGTAVFTLGTVLTIFATDLTLLMVGRAVQGVGVGGMMPLSMALIAAIFAPHERGKALGTWSSVGPIVGFVAPLAMGFVVDHWGWRVAFAPSLLLGGVALVAVAIGIPAGLSQIKPNFLRTFDWVGALLLSLTLTSLIVYLSSRPVTGIDPLQDWRLLALTGLFGLGFVAWEQRHPNPFVELAIFRNRMFSLASFCGMTRMFIMSGLSFLVALYLADVRGFGAAQIGGITMFNAGAMVLIVRFGGQAADHWGSRWPTVIGLSVQVSVMVILALLPINTPSWLIALVMVYYGLGAGLVLAALHRAAMGHVADAQLGMAAGLYSMSRFAGAAAGTALGGVILQRAFDQGLSLLAAYQVTFLAFAGLASVGIVAAFGLREH